MISIIYGDQMDDVERSENYIRQLADTSNRLSGNKHLPRKHGIFGKWFKILFLLHIMYYFTTYSCKMVHFLKFYSCYVLIFFEYETYLLVSLYQFKRYAFLYNMCHIGTFYV